MLFVLFISLLKDNLFPEYFLFSVEPQHESAIGVYIHPLPFEPPSPLPPHPTPLG